MLILLGFGLSDKPNKALSVKQLADSLVQFMNVANISKACLFGNSLGCQIIAHVAANYPDRVDRIILQGIWI